MTAVSGKAHAVQHGHHIVDHAVANVRGRVHTNGLENFWSLLKRRPDCVGCARQAGSGAEEGLEGQACDGQEAEGGVQCLKVGI